MRWMMMLALVGLVGCSQKVDPSSPEFRAAVLEVLKSEGNGVELRGVRVVDDDGELRAMLTTSDVPGRDHAEDERYTPPPAGVLRVYDEKGKLRIAAGHLWGKSGDNIRNYPAVLWVNGRTITSATPECRCPGKPQGIVPPELLEPEYQHGDPYGILHPDMLRPERYIHNPR